MNWIGLGVVAASLALGGSSELRLDVKETRLPNGLTVLMLEDRSVPTFSYMTFVNAGARDEAKPGTTGIAHVFEHMMFRGTKRFPKYDDTLAPMGPETNASTGQDLTRYFVNARSEFLDRVIEVEADRFKNLGFTNETFRTELGPVKEERRRGYVDSPDGFLFTKLYETAFTTHTYHHPVIGFEEDLEKNMTYQDALEFYRTHYSPNGCVIVLAGNFDSARALESIRKNYGDWERQPPSPYAVPEEPPQTQERRVTLTWKDDQVTPRLVIGFHGPRLSTDTIDSCALDVASQILFLDSQRLTKRLYAELGLVDSIRGSMTPSKDPNLFIVSAVLKRGKDPEAVKRIVLEELDRIGREEPTANEMEKAKNAIKANLLYGLNRPYAIANTIGFHQIVGGSWRTISEIARKVQEVTPKDVVEVARKTFRPENRTVLTLLPKSAATVEN